MGGHGFGQVHRVPGGAYRASYIHPALTGARHTAPGTFDDVTDAYRWLDGEYQLIVTGGWAPPSTRTHPADSARPERAGQPAFGVFATGYLHDRDDLRASTRATYLTVLHNHLIPAFGLVPVAAIDQAAVRAWWASYGTRTPAARTSAYVLLKNVMTAAVAAGLIPRNPCTPTPAATPTRTHHPGRTRRQQGAPATTPPDHAIGADPSVSRSVADSGSASGFRFEPPSRPAGRLGGSKWSKY